MSNPISNHPRGIRGAFVEYSHGPPLLVVPFQFNPVQLQRSRSLSITAPGATSTTSTTKAPRTLHLDRRRLPYAAAICASSIKTKNTPI
ncbi:MAG: hypothetical protein R3E79_10845 [Caldilineaceae bacterium]